MTLYVGRGNEGSDLDLIVFSNDTSRSDPNNMCAVLVEKCRFRVPAAEFTAEGVNNVRITPHRNKIIRRKINKNRSLRILLRDIGEVPKFNKNLKSSVSYL